MTSLYKAIFFIVLWIPCISVSTMRWPYMMVPLFVTHTSYFCVYSQCPIHIHNDAYTFRYQWSKILSVDKKGTFLHLFCNYLDYKKNIIHASENVIFGRTTLVTNVYDKKRAVGAEEQGSCADNVHDRALVVRVLLGSCECDKTGTWKFNSADGMKVSLCDMALSTICKSFFIKGKITVTVKNGTVLLNGKKIVHGLRIHPVNGHIECNGTAYDGEFCITMHKNTYLCVNHVDLEDYIAAVLRTESWPGWPLEVNKAFAIACRSYVSAQALEAKKSSRPYHVKNSNVHQTYRGKHEIALLKDAVKQTKGIVLGHHNKPILAMFDSCCGGVIPAHVADFDFKKAPYLARTYACTYCKNCSLYSWMVTYDHHKFNTLCSDHTQHIKNVHDIVTKKDKAGLVTEVMLHGRTSYTTVSGKTLYSLLKEVKSFHFDVVKKPQQYIFSGRGYGHHMGLCQWGARQMVREGWDYKSILQFYYPRTHFMKIM